MSIRTRGVAFGPSRRREAAAEWSAELETPWSEAAQGAVTLDDDETSARQSVATTLLGGPERANDIRAFAASRDQDDGAGFDATLQRPYAEAFDVYAKLNKDYDQAKGPSAKPIDKASQDPHETGHIGFPTPSFQQAVWSDLRYKTDAAFRNAAIAKLAAPKDTWPSARFAGRAVRDDARATSSVAPTWDWNAAVKRNGAAPLTPVLERNTIPQVNEPMIVPGGGGGGVERIGPGVGLGLGLNELLRQLFEGGDAVAPEQTTKPKPRPTPAHEKQPAPGVGEPTPPETIAGLPIPVAIRGNPTRGAAEQEEERRKVPVFLVPRDQWPDIVAFENTHIPMNAPVYLTIGDRAGARERHRRALALGGIPERGGRPPGMEGHVFPAKDFAESGLFGGAAYVPQRQNSSHGGSIPGFKRRNRLVPGDAAGYMLIETKPEQK